MAASLEIEEMAEESILPSSLVALGEALRPVALKLRTDMAREPLRTDREDDMLEFAWGHLGMIREDIQRIESEINDGLAVVDSPADAHRAVGRLEVRLERLLSRYHDVKSVSPSLDDAEGWSLVRDVYRRLLIEIRRWIDELVEVLDDPIAALKARGLPTEGRVEIPLTLTMTASPELERLIRWAEDRASDKEEEHQASRSTFGFWALLLAVFGLGWMFGDDE